jgi:hypothetical protein
LRDGVTGNEPNATVPLCQVTRVCAGRSSCFSRLRGWCSAQPENKDLPPRRTCRKPLISHSRLTNRKTLSSSSIRSINLSLSTNLTLLTMPPRMTDRFCGPSMRLGMNQRRTFLGLQRTPPPNPRMMGYLVIQGLAVVLLVDVSFATALGHQTIMRKIAQSAGIWKEAPSFDTYHHVTSSGS